MARVKNSVGIWSFGGNATRFVPGGPARSTRTAHDAVAAYEIVYKTLGLDDKFIRQVHDSRKKK